MFDAALLNYLVEHGPWLLIGVCIGAALAGMCVCGADKGAE